MAAADQLSHKRPPPPRKNPVWNPERGFYQLSLKL